MPGEVDAAGNPLVHGHNYAVVVVLETGQLSEADWVYSRDTLDRIMIERVLGQVHQRNLDLWIQPATGEKICEAMASELLQTDLGKYLVEIQLEETRKNTFNLRIDTRSPVHR